MLNHLARVVPKKSVMIWGPIGTNELDRDGLLARSLEELIRLRLVEQINLGGLPRDAVAEVIRDFSGAALPQPLVTLLHTVTEGNPFFLGELYRHLVERGQPLDRADQLRTDLDLAGADLPQNLRLVLGRRLRRVSNETRKILGFAAVMGRSFPFDLLEAATQVEANSLLDHVEEAERTGLITSTLQHPNARFQFSHELIRRAVLSEMSAPRRQRLHLRIADAIEQFYGNAVEDHSDDLAHHLWGAGAAAEPERTIRWLKAAAKRAMQQGAYQAAVRYLQNELKVLNRLPQSPERMRQELGVRISLIDPLTATKGYSAVEVQENCDAALKLCKQSGERPELSSVLGGLTSVYFNRGELSKALGLARQMLRIAEATRKPQLLLWAHYASGFVLQDQGELRLAREHLEQSCDLYDRSRAGSYGFVQDPGPTARLLLALVFTNWVIRDWLWIEPWKGSGWLGSYLIRSRWRGSLVTPP